MNRVAGILLIIGACLAAYWSGRYDLTFHSFVIGILVGVATSLLAFRYFASKYRPPVDPLANLTPNLKPVGIVAFSFALRSPELEPNPCNIKVAQAVERIAREEMRPIVIVAQWEVARQLRADGFGVARSVELREDNTYLDSDIVWAEAEEIFRSHGIEEVIPVAQPFMQLTKIRMMLNRSGYKILKRKVGWIGFDKESAQPWTRGPIRLFAYSVKQLLIGLRGHKGQQSI